MGGFLWPYWPAESKSRIPFFLTPKVDDKFVSKRYHNHEVMKRSAQRAVTKRLAEKGERDFQQQEQEELMEPFNEFDSLLATSEQYDRW